MEFSWCALIYDVCCTRHCHRQQRLIEREETTGMGSQTFSLDVCVSDWLVTAWKFSFANYLRFVNEIRLFWLPSAEVVIIMHRRWSDKSGREAGFANPDCSTNSKRWRSRCQDGDTNNGRPFWKNIKSYFSREILLWQMPILRQSIKGNKKKLCNCISRAYSWN